ncbi:hypothetical protein C8R46DRAFT_955250 [Mycena filopes]|nr:hypothetical protein C8R46DRAFT_955250 [Mycena filopes]
MSTPMSPFSAHLGTNYCPSDQEVLDINSILVEPSLRLKNLDQEIADLQKAIDKLAAERKTIGTFVDAHKALTSPVRRLPLDIIEGIFIACLPTHRNCVMSASEAPVLLGRICRAWRTISLSTPQLWASLHITHPSPEEDSAIPTSLVAETAALRLAAAKEWLRRSGQCALSLSYVVPRPSAPGTGAPSVPIQSQFLQLIVQLAQRWQHIRFIPSGPMDSETLGIHHLTDTDVPLLETLQIDSSVADPAAPPTVVDFESLQSLGILRAARLSTCSIPDGFFVSPQTLPLRWEQLTTLSLAGAPSSWDWDPPAGLAAGVVLNTLSRCPALQRCTLTVKDEPPLNPPSQDIVDLALLHTLEIYCVGNITHIVSTLLQRLSMPVLRKFVFRGSRGTPSNGSLAPFIALAAKLEDFEVDVNLFSKVHLLETLGSLPSTVNRLSVCHTFYSPLPSPLSTPLDDDILALLTPSVGSPAICCPALKTFVVENGGLISDAALLRFITARRDAGTLQRVAVVFRRRRTLELDRLLASFIQTGLEVSIIHYPIRTFSREFSPWKGLDDDYTVSWEPAVIGLPYSSFRLANW